MASRYVSTGQAAQICSVAPDTILKWVHSGRLPAWRTPGRHHRIDRRDLERVLAAAAAPTPAPAAVAPSRRVSFCWQRRAPGGRRAGCRRCIVYRLRARRCYDAPELPPEQRHARLRCDGACRKCDYYQRVHKQRRNVLVVTGDRGLAAALRREAADAAFNLELADGEYACSAVVERFRPDLAVIDGELAAPVRGSISRRLTDDPRLPFVRIALAGIEPAPRDDCEEVMFACLARPFDVRDLNQCVSGGIAPRGGTAT